MTVARASSQPSPETRLLSVAEVTDWARRSIPGESLVYCVGPSVPAGPTKTKVTDLKNAGVVRPQLRREGGVLQHFVIKRPDVPVSLELTDGDEAMEKIFLALKKCAVRGLRAYSDARLAQLAGLSTRNQASWRVRKLIEAGRLRSETVAGPDGPWRIVIIGRRRSATP